VIQTRDILSKTQLLYQLVFFLVDMIALAVSCIMCFWLVFNSVVMPLHYNVALILAMLLGVGLFVSLGLYELNSQRYGYPLLARLTLVLAMSFTCLVVMAFFLKVATDFSRFWLGSWFLSALVFIYLGRLLSSLVIYKINDGWLLQHKIIIIGDEVSVKNTSARLLQWEFSNVLLLGKFFDGSDSTTKDNNHLGPLVDAYQYVANNKVDQVWLAFELDKNTVAAEQCLAQLKDSLPEIKLVPSVAGLHLANHSIEIVAGMPVLNLSMSPIHGVNRVLKYLQDKILSLLALVFLAPLFLVIAIAVKLSSPGPIIYSQKRMSWNGNTFDIYKFRSMPAGAEDDTGAVWAEKNESRATRVGSFLRKTSLDELPQFYNVFKGDMSIVGPRPERPIFVNEFKNQVPGYMLKHKVNAGITGWAQVCGYRGDTDLAKRIDCDLYYIENWSLIFDLKIIFFTAVQVFIPSFAIDTSLKHG
jgi:putative colanic acid biosynthesis UDP-glucose lipid carrier transferase